jgi:hypothetical protein
MEQYGRLHGSVLSVEVTANSGVEYTPRLYELIRGAERISDIVLCKPMSVLNEEPIRSRVLSEQRKHPEKYGL